MLMVSTMRARWKGCITWTIASSQPCFYWTTDSPKYWHSAVAQDSTGGQPRAQWLLMKKYNFQVPLLIFRPRRHRFKISTQRNEKVGGSWVTLKNSGMILSTLYTLHAWQSRKTNGGLLKEAVGKVAHIILEKFPPCWIWEFYEVRNSQFYKWFLPFSSLKATWYYFIYFILAFCASRVAILFCIL